MYLKHCNSQCTIFNQVNYIEKASYMESYLPPEEGKQGF